MVLAREPVAGQVKTRLIPAIGARRAAEVYAWLLERTCACAQAAGFATRYLFTAEAEQRDYFAARLRDTGWELAVQARGNLGERMHDAFDRVLGRHGFAVLIGTDIVDLTTADLDTARRSLARGLDAVIGPAADGGYWLIGLRETCPELFDEIAWGTPEVYRQTRAMLDARGRRWAALALRHDIDCPADLARLPRDAPSGADR